MTLRRVENERPALSPSLAASEVLDLLKSEGYARRADVLEEAARVAESEALVSDTGRVEDVTYDLAIKHAAEAIRALATPPTDTPKEN